MFKKAFPLIIVFLVALWAAYPLLTPGFIPTHDGEYHFIRFFEFDKNIKAGEFFPRWAPGLNSGFGVPLFNFFYPFPNYVAEIFHLLGFAFVDSFKLTLAAGLILGGIFFYLWGGVVGAIFYTLAPYHLVDVYVRGSVGEVWALVWLPAVLWSLKKRFFVLTGLFFALLILSHNILALIFTPFLLAYAFFNSRFSPLTLILGLGLSSYFWLPALVESKYVTGLRLVNFTDHFPILPQLLFPSWGTGFSGPGIIDEMSFQIGLPHLLVVFLSLFFRSSSTFFFLFWFLLVFFLLSEISLPIWKFVPLMALFQYPWRLLSLMILITSFLAADLASLKKSKILTTILIFLAFAFYGGYTRPVKYPPRDDKFYLENPLWRDGTATLADSFATIWAPGRQPQRAKEKLVIIQGNSEVKEVFIKPTHYSFQVEALTPARLRVNTVYFPGWKVFVNDKETPINFTDGLINFQISAGKHLVEVKLTETPIRALANRISFLSLLFLAGAVILRGRGK